MIDLESSLSLSTASSSTEPAGPAVAPVRVLLVHNRYQRPGGEDTVFEAEGQLLEARGHFVSRFEVHNDEVDALSRGVLAARTLWSTPAYRAIHDRVRDEQIDVVHFHNTLPLVSPAGYWAARRAGAAVVQTLHNYRLVCPGSLLYRDGGVCTECLGKLVAAPAVRHACYRDSRATTAAVATTTAVHRGLGTYAHAVDRYVVLTAFAKDVFERGGLPADRLVVKSNFLPQDPGAGIGGEGFALFVGRLDEAKGIQTLLEAWERDDLPPLVVVGDGPMAGAVQVAQDAGRLDWRGWLPHEVILSLMRDAEVLVVPSLWYEGAPMTIVEAFASGLPVVASDLGAMRTMVEEQHNGLRFPAGDAGALADAVRRITTHASFRLGLGHGARHTFETNYHADVNYHRLLAVYADALRQRHGRTLAD